MIPLTTPYEPKRGGDSPLDRQIDARCAEFYAGHGITTAILTEPCGFRLAVYQRGVEIPAGLQGVAEALTKVA